MTRRLLLILLGLVPTLCAADDPGGVLKQLTIASFPSSNLSSITATASDASGNVYVAGTTNASDLPVKNAFQAQFAESLIMRSTDQGATWTRVGSPPEGVGTIAVDPINPLVLFASSASGVYRSSDGGSSWKLVYPTPPGTLSSLAIDPANHLRVAALAISTGQIVRSVDGGDTWTKGGTVLNAVGGGPVSGDPTGSGALLMGPSISFDWGLTFVSIPPPGQCCGSELAVFDPLHPGWIYAEVGLGAKGTLWLSKDFGKTWTAKVSPGAHFSLITALTLDPSQPDTLVAVAPEGLYLSKDGAVTWNLVNNLPANSSVAPVLLPATCGASGKLFAPVAPQGVAFSADYGMTFRPAQLSSVRTLTAGPGCSAYVTRFLTTDAFVSKLSSDGTPAWTTYLGGLNLDTPGAIAVDPQGNVYVAGTTSSPDFPVTATPIGPRATSSAFLSRFTPDGKLDYSITIGGSGANGVTALALDQSQNVYLAGTTTSTDFPVTSGALASTDASGFVVKLSPSAGLQYAATMGPGFTPSAIVVDSNGQATVASANSFESATGFVTKLDRAGSSVLASVPMDGTVSSLALDASGQLYIAGTAFKTVFATTPGAYRSAYRSSACGKMGAGSLGGGDLFVAKLNGSDWSPVYVALVAGQCLTTPGGLLVDSSGAVTVPVSAGPGLPLRNPLVAGPTCTDTSSAVIRLSPDGSAIPFATYLDDCQIPVLASAPGGSVYIGVGVSGKTPGVLKLAVSDPPLLTVDGIANAFSADARAVTPGGLYTVTSLGLNADFADLGLNAAQTLPTELKGVQVFFDGTPAPILQTNIGYAIVVAPLFHTGTTLTSVQIASAGIRSGMVWMPVAGFLPGLLTRTFPSPLRGLADGNIRNSDGTLNDPSHPAAPGSFITAYATGAGNTTPQFIPGSIAQSLDATSVTPIYDPWSSIFAKSNFVASMPGFVAGVLQVRSQVPANAASLAIDKSADGTSRVPFGLQGTTPFGLSLSTVSNIVNLYVK